MWHNEGELLHHGGQQLHHGLDVLSAEGGITSVRCSTRTYGLQRLPSGQALLLESAHVLPFLLNELLRRTLGPLLLLDRGSRRGDMDRRGDGRTHWGRWSGCYSAWFCLHWGSRSQQTQAFSIKLLHY